MKIREATIDNAKDIGSLAKEFDKYLRALGDPTNFQFNAETYIRDGFGYNPAFKGLVAEENGTVVGYLLYHPGYDTDLAMRVFYVVDLFVGSAFRRRGIGRALMERVSEICLQEGGKSLFWSVYSPNQTAFRFYEQIGAYHNKEMEIMYLPLTEDAIK